jgi:hypothetical protein
MVVTNGGRETWLREEQYAKRDSLMAVSKGGRGALASAEHE